MHIGSALAGSKVTITVNNRFGRDLDVEATLAKAKNEQPFIASVRPEPIFGLRVDYSSILAQQRPLGNMGVQPTLPLCAGRSLGPRCGGEFAGRDEVQDPRR